jgi:curli biogenesis system outer membrane secretion channel CsgG
MQGTRAMSWLGIVASLVLFAGCADTMDRMMGPSPTVSHTTPSTIPQVQSTWHGEKARVAVMEFDDKTGTYYQATSTSRGYAAGAPVGRGMKEQMVTALMETGAFIVLERNAIKDVVGEQDFGHSGRVKRETAPDIGEIEGAEFLIYGAVTEYTPEQTNVQGGVGIGATGGAILGIPGGALIGGLAEQALSASASQNHVAIDIRVVDARTGRVVNSTSVQAKANDLGGTMGGLFGTTLVGLSGSYQTPTQKAVRACIIKAVNWIADQCMEYRQAVSVTPGPSTVAPDRPRPPTRPKPPVKPTKPTRPGTPKPDEKPGGDEWGQQ